MKALSTTQKLTAFGLLAAGLLMIALGFTAITPDEFNVYWMAAGAAIISGGLMITGPAGVNAATYFARIVVGSLFVVSGLIKANDTLGFAYKLEEYFDEKSLGAFWAIFHDYSLVLSILITAVEIVLGLAVLFGGKSRLVNITLLAMTVFFAWLTWFTATCNDAQTAAMSAGEAFDKVCVNDCGCFGDAMRGSVGRSLTPWESFYKDLTLMFLVVVLLVESARIKLNTWQQDAIIFIPSTIFIAIFGGWLFGWWFPNVFALVAFGLYMAMKHFVRHRHIEWMVAAAMFVMAFGFAIYTYAHLPIKDYRPYAVGNNIHDQMKSAEELGLEPTIYANIYNLKHKETGEQKVANSKEYLDQKMWNEWDVESSSDESILIQRGYEPPIPVFIVNDADGMDVGEDLLNESGYSFWLIAYKIDGTDVKIQPAINAFAEAAQADGAKFIGITSSGYDEVEDFRHTHQNAFPYYTADEIFLKTIVRSNPGILLVKDGTILAKWNRNDLPSYQNVKTEFLIK
jgi:uncharacterized membrane protein YphA (DoxX/SURF4 family)